MVTFSLWMNNIWDANSNTSYDSSKGATFPCHSHDTQLPSLHELSIFFHLTIFKYFFVFLFSFFNLLSLLTIRTLLIAHWLFAHRLFAHWSNDIVTILSWWILMYYYESSKTDNGRTYFILFSIPNELTDYI